VILATGSEAKMLPGLKADDRILTNIEILAMDAVPKSLIVIGAGAVGMEFGSLFRTFGSEVTILEFLRAWFGGRRGNFQGDYAPLQEARHRCEHWRKGREGRKD